MHPELFELKALVAGRLDAHRRREIDDHLGSCADCSRQYVALMLGSSSPKTAEAEARTVLVPHGSGTVLTALPQGAAAGYGSYIVGQAAKYYFEHGASWGGDGGGVRHRRTTGAVGTKAACTHWYHARDRISSGELAYAGAGLRESGGCDREAASRVRGQSRSENGRDPDDGRADADWRNSDADSAVQDRRNSSRKIADTDASSADRCTDVRVVVDRTVDLHADAGGRDFNHSW